MKRIIPNLLSVSRIAGMPVAICIAFQGTEKGFFLALIILQITDFLDGYLARKWGAQSEIGAKLDIVGDACNYMTGAIGLMMFRIEFFSSLLLPLIVVFAVLYLGRFVFSRLRRQVWLFPVNHPSGKVNYYCQSILMVFLYFDLSFSVIPFTVAVLAGSVESCFYLKTIHQEGFDVSFA